MKKEHIRKLGYLIISGSFVLCAYMIGIFQSIDRRLMEDGSEWNLWLQAYSQSETWKYIFIIWIILLLIAALVIQVNWKKKQNTDPRGFIYAAETTYGNARPERPHQYSQIAQIRSIEDCCGVVLGQLGEGCRQCIDFYPVSGRVNPHMLVIGTSGSGKSYTFVKTNLYQAEKRRHSVILTDPDGGLFRDTAGFFQDRGYVVRCLNFKTLSLSDGWNCMEKLCDDPERMFDSVDIFSNTIIRNISRDESVYTRAAGSLLKALVLRVLLGEEYPEDKKNIREVFRLLQNPGGLEFLEQMFDPQLLSEAERPCIEPYLAFKRASVNLASNILTELANGLSLLQNPEVCDVLSTPEIDLTLPGKVPCIYYCQFPDTHDTYRFLISLFFSMLFTTLCDYADLHTEDGRLPVPVDFLLDEFPSIGILPDWHTKMAVVRKRGISITMIIQGIPQLQNNYKDAWIPIADNCDTTVILGVNDPVVTAPWVSAKAGITTIEVQSFSDKDGSGLRKYAGNKTTSRVKRELFTKDEVMRLGTDEIMVFFSKHCPILCRGTPHTEHPAFLYQRTILPSERLPFRDRTGREIYHDAEKLYLEKYWNVHSSEVKKQTDNSVCERNDDISPVVCFLKIAGEDIRRILNSRKSSEETKPNTEKKTRCEEENEWSFSKFYMEYRKEHPCKEKTSPVSKPTEEAVIVKDEVQRPMKNRTGTLE